MVQSNSKTERQPSAVKTTGKRPAAIAHDGNKQAEKGADGKVAPFKPKRLDRKECFPY